MKSTIKIVIGKKNFSLRKTDDQEKIIASLASARYSWKESTCPAT
jgi:hypothetical protein